MISTTDRCELTELPSSMCAHCLGHTDAPSSAPARRAPSFHMAIDKVLDLAHSPHLEADTWLYAGWKWPMRHFDNFQPLMEPETLMADYGEDIYVDIWPADLATPLDFCMGANVSDGGANHDQFVIHRYRQVRKPLLPVKHMARYVIEVARVYIDPGTGFGKTSARYFGINGPDPARWLHLQLGRPLAKCEMGWNEIGSLKVAMGYHFARGYHWHVRLNRPGAKAGTMIPTTPQGARELFKLRDYEPGETRRKALRHWVNGHTRRIHAGTTQEDLTWVHDHLRGRNRFTWNDMEGDIQVSGHDLERLKQRAGTGR